MDPKIIGGPDDLDWADVDACTLPTTERPLRLAEFDDLFATALRSTDRTDDTHARLLLAGPGVAERTRRLAGAEASCCSFFTFTVTELGEGQVAFDIAVPAAYAEVLRALVARAEGALRRA